MSLPTATDRLNEAVTASLGQNTQGRRHKTTQTDSRAPSIRLRISEVDLGGRKKKDKGQKGQSVTAGSTTYEL